MLRGIGEELKGWTHMDKPYVAKKTILHAVRRQNELILALQAKISYALQKEVGASKKRSCMVAVVPITDQGRNEVHHIRVKAGIGRPY